jgi:hypothetical protein
MNPNVYFPADNKAFQPTLKTARLKASLCSLISIGDRLAVFASLKH